LATPAQRTQGTAPSPGSPRRGKQVLVLAVVVALCTTAVLAIGILLFGHFGELEGRILITTALLAAYGLLALPAGFLFDQARLERLAGALVLMTAAGFALAIAAAWWPNEPPAALGKANATATVFAVAAAQIAALAARQRTSDPLSVRRLFASSAVLVLAVATMVSIAAWAEIGAQGYFRILGSIAVLDVLAVALQPILALSRSRGSTYRLRVRVEPSGTVEMTVEAANLAAASAKAIRAIERDGREVTGLERLGPSPSANGRPFRVRQQERGASR
jgi:MFS family permease